MDILNAMSTAPVLDREEYVEQAYFFRTFRERLADNLPAQDVLARAPRGAALAARGCR